MATSETDLVNIGLTKLGERRISSLTESSPVARAATALYATSRDFVLSEHPWNGCVKREALALLAGTPAYEYSYQFAYPSNCLRVLGVSHDYEWTVETGTDGTTKVILANVSELSARYIYRVTNVSMYSAGLKMAVGAYLAWQLALAITAHRGKAEDMAKWYAAQLSLGKGIDGQEGSPVVLEIPTLTTDIR